MSVIVSPFDSFIKHIKDLTDIDLSLKEAYQVINDSWYGAMIYIDVSRPDSFVFTDIILCEE